MHMKTTNNYFWWWGYSGDGINTALGGYWHLTFEEADI